MRVVPRRSVLPLFLLFFLSGFSGLVLEVVWVRLAALALGVTVFAVSTVVAGFMGGLALGGWLGAQVSDRRSLGVGAYALLEVGISASALAATWFLTALPGILGSSFFARPHTSSSQSVVLLEALLASLALLVPCTLMGATLPVLSRAVGSMEGPSRMIGWLYGVNTLGAVAGAFLTDLVLVPSLGVWQSAVLAASFNLLAGALALALRGNIGPSVLAPREVPHQTRAIWLLLAYGLSGFCALALQVVWFRLLAVTVFPRIYVFSIILATYLASISLGSALGSPFSTRIRRPGVALCLTLVAIAVTSLSLVVSLRWFEEALRQPPLANLVLVLARPFGAELGLQIAPVILQSMALFGLPTFLMGFAFPLACAVALRGQGGIGQPIGQLYSANTLGSILGALAAGFVLLPGLGVQGSMALLGALLLVAAGLVLPYCEAPRWPAGGALALAAGLVVAFMTLPSDWLMRHFNLYVYKRAYGIEQSQIVSAEEDLYGTVVVAKNTRVGDVLLMNGTMMMNSKDVAHRYAKLMAHLPLLLHTAPRKALVICFGTGMTFGATSLHRELAETWCVELSPAVLRSAHHFSEANERVAQSQDPRVRILQGDGRNFLLRTRERFDLITFEPPPPSNPGVVNLYSEDYYRLCRERLTEDGMVCQWLPLPLVSDPTNRMIVKTFLQVFPEATLWEGGVDDYLLVGFARPTQIDAAALAERLAALSAPLGQIGLDNVIDLLATFKRGPRGLERYAAGSRVISDDHPYLEYAMSLQPPVSDLRISDLSELKTLVTGLSDEQLAQIQRRATALQRLQEYGRLPFGLTDEIMPYLLRYRLARDVQAEMGDNLFATQMLQAGANFHFDLPGAPLQAAFRLLVRRENARAELLLRAAQKQFPDHPTAYLLEAISESEQGHDVRARELLATGLSLVKDAGLRELVRDFLAEVLRQPFSQ